MYQTEKLLNKYLYIFMHGSLVFGCSMALFSSVLIELSYPAPDMQIFFVNFYKRLFISLPVFMLSGIVYGHWRWTLHRQKIQSTEP